MYFNILDKPKMYVPIQPRNNLTQATDFSFSFGYLQQRYSASSSSQPSFMDFPSVNTGPKGVLNDYRIAKERAEKRMKEQRERDHAFVEKSTMTVTSVSQDDKNKLSAKIDQMDEDELDALGTTGYLLSLTRCSPHTALFGVI